MSRATLQLTRADYLGSCCSGEMVIPTRYEDKTTHSGVSVLAGSDQLSLRITSTEYGDVSSQLNIKRIYRIHGPVIWLRLK